MINVRRNSRKRLERLRGYLVSQMAGGCADCGTTDLRVLDFDHVRGIKIDNINRMLLYANLETLRSEVAKCEVRCKNCHAIATFRRLGGTWRDRAQARISAEYIPKVYNGPVTHRDTLLSLLVSSNRLIRIAAQAAGSTTPSAQWRTLSILETDGAMRVGALADASRVTQPGMTRLLATMTEEALVSRVADPADSRATVIEISQKGRDELKRWREVISETLEPRFQSLDDEEWVALELAARVLASRTAAEVAA